MDIAEINTPKGQIEHLAGMARELAAQDITHSDLGSTSGFHDAEESKNALCEYVIDILDRSAQHLGNLNDVVLEQAIRHISSALSQVKKNVEHIETLVDQGIHNEKFPTQRDSYTAALQKALVSVKQHAHPFELDLKLCEITDVLSSQDYLSTAKDEAAGHVDAAKSAAKKVEKVLLNLQSKTVSQGVAESQSHFGTLKDNHEQFEWSWFVAFVAASIGSAAVIWKIFSLEPPDQLSVAFGIQLLQKGLLLSAAGVAMRLCLTKYNTERKLRIVYQHREKVLDQYRSFEAGIGDDNPEAKNAFRLEIAKYIFSDPKSGYDQTNAVGTEIHLNPIVSAVENIAKK